MSQALIDKLRRARERQVEVGGHKFTIRRPTDGEILAMGELVPLAFVKRFVTGWDLVELDLVPGGGPEPVPFDPLLWAEYVNDHKELWKPIGDAIDAEYDAHEKRLEDAKKK